MEAGSATYLWLKVGHVVAMVAWMAGLFYLPRLMAYHAREAPRSAAWETFGLMERRLLRIIANPAMVATLGFGAALAAAPGAVAWEASGWIYVKLALVLALVVLHALLARWRRVFAEGRLPHSERFFRRVNEVPTVALIGIVILVVIKPF